MRFDRKFECLAIENDKNHVIGRICEMRRVSTDGNEHYHGLLLTTCMHRSQREAWPALSVPTVLTRASVSFATVHIIIIYCGRPLFFLSFLSVSVFLPSIQIHAYYRWFFFFFLFSHEYKLVALTLSERV